MIERPRLLVIARGFPFEDFENARYTLNSLLGSKIKGLEMIGSGAYSFSSDDLLDWAVLGKNTLKKTTLRNVQKGCELYLGVKTPLKEYSGIKTKDERFDVFQLGERGFDLAKQRKIPAILLNNYDLRLISDFINNNC